MKGARVCPHLKFLVFILDHLGNFEVNQADIASIWVIQNILGLYISMADSESVQILNRFEDGVDELRSLVF